MLDTLQFLNCIPTDKIVELSYENDNWNNLISLLMCNIFWP